MSLTEQEQAIYFHARERRRSLAGIVELHKTHHIFNKPRTLTVTGATNATPIVITTSVDHGLVTGMTTTVTEVTGNTAANTTAVVTVLTSDTYELDGTVGDGDYVDGGQVDTFADMAVPLISTSDIFPDVDTLITFETTIRILEGTGVGSDEHRGLIFEFGDAVTGSALWVGDQTIGFHSGDDSTVDGATALFDNSVEWPETLELGIVVATRPGDGRVRMWGNGIELDRSVASGDSFPNGFAAASDGSFAAAAQGDVVPDVPAGSQGAPSGFEIIEPLSIYARQVPRHFI